jgi:hypothetical protein
MTDLNVAEVHARGGGYDATAFFGVESVQRLWRKRYENEQTTSGQRQQRKWTERGTIGGCHTASSVSHYKSEMKVPKGHSRFIPDARKRMIIAGYRDVLRHKQGMAFRKKPSRNVPFGRHILWIASGLTLQL